MTNPVTTLVTPRRAALLAGFDNTLDLLVLIQAPDAPSLAAAPRPPYALALVIDRSGSMSGEPLAQAKRCAAFVAGRLRGDDCVALVSFNNKPRLVHPAQPRGDGYALIGAIQSIDTGGNTNLHGGWQTAVDALSALPATQAAAMKRVILLSDGVANAGIIRPEEIVDHVATAAAHGISTSTYGLGNNFNEDLMVAMGRAGQGNHYYGETAADLMEPFEQELALLDNLCLRDLNLTATVPQGVRLQLLNPFHGSPEQGWRLPDLAYGAEAWVVLRLTLPKALIPEAGQTLHFLELNISGVPLQGEAAPIPPSWVALPVLAPEAFSAIAEDELVLRRLAELDAADLLASARGAAGAGDWEEVHRLLAQAETRFADHPWVMAMIGSIRKLAVPRSRGEFRKEAMYSGVSLQTRLAQRNERLELSEEDQAAYLRRKRAQGKSGPDGQA